MPINILMPALSPTMETGTLTKWHKAEGDTVESGDIIAEIETDKATMEFEAVDEGVIGKILIAEGAENVAVNTAIAVLLEDGETSADMEGHSTEVVVKPAVPELKEAVKENVKDAPPKTVHDAKAVKQDAQGSPKGNRIFASPLARRIAKQNGIDLANVQGSGPRGRVVKADVDAAISGKIPGEISGKASVAVGSSAPAASTSMAAGVDAKKLADQLGMPYRAEPNSGMRKTIASRLLQSKQTVPHYYLSLECRLDTLLSVRKQINDGADGAYKISVNDFIVKAVGVALKAVPEANTSWTDEATLFYERADVSVAVATDAGLITPIVENADQKSLRTISEQVKDLATRARDGKLKPTEYQGGTCSVSNLGMFGIKQFSAIINPPQSAIVAVGAGEVRPAFDEAGNVVKATFMTITGSFDHRTIDGAVGAQFLGAIKRGLENPLSLMV